MTYYQENCISGESINYPIGRELGEDALQEGDVPEHADVRSKFEWEVGYVTGVGSRLPVDFDYYTNSWWLTY